MNWVALFVDSLLAQAIGWTLIHFIWQGLAIAMGAALALRSLRRLAPESRYASGLGALLLLALAPVLTFAYVFNTSEIASPLSTIEFSAPPAAVPVSVGDMPAASAAPFNTAALAAPRLPWVGWTAFLWLTGVVAMSLRLLGGWVCTQRLRNDLTAPLEKSLRDKVESWRQRLGIKREVRAAQSALIDVPVVVGWLKPVLLLPAEGIRVLKLNQLEPLIVHELAHVFRNDYVVNLFQSLLETLLFFHPGVWWVSSRVRLERECCCDAMTIQHFGDRDAYAEALIALESMRQSTPNELALAALRPGMLLQRIRRMYESPAPETARQPWAPVLAFTALFVCALAGGVLAQTPNELPAHSAKVETTDAAPPISVAKVPGTVTPAAVAPAVASYVASTPDKPAPAALLLPLEIVGSAVALSEPAQQLDVLLSTRLSDSPGIRLVDRAQLDAAMKELQLSQSGLTSPETALQLGRITGAASIITGKLMQLDGQRMLTARLINSETSEYRQFEIATPVDAPLVDLAAAAAEKLAPMLATQPSDGSVQATGDAEITALRATLAGRKLPRVTVSIPESHLGTFVPDPAGEIEMIRTLRALGFNVVDVTTLAPKSESSSWMDFFFDRSPDGDDFAVALREGMSNAATLEHNERIKRLKAHTDIFVFGEAFSEFSGEMHGFQSCQARVEVRGLDVANGSIAAADSRHASAADLGEFVAGKKALREAGRQTALALAPLLAEYWSTQIAAAPQ